MKDNQIRVAQIMGKMNNGGVEAVVMNYYRAINKNIIQFDFIVDEDSLCPQREEIEKLGGRVIFVPSYSHFFKYQKALFNIFRKNNYSIVHSHITTLNIFPLRIAKKCGVKVRISHAHSTAGSGELIKNTIKTILRPFSKLYPTHLFACGEYAGRWLYGNRAFNKGRVCIIKNAIPWERFIYSKSKGEELRTELGIKKNTIVIGNIGRFVPQKNHKFLIKAFKKIHDVNADTMLVLIGDGPLEDNIKKVVNAEGLLDSVMFLGIKSDAAPYYNLFDCFMLPSIYEGLPVVAIEAQFNGLPCFFSDRMTKEVLINDNARMLPLSLKFWNNASSLERVEPNIDALKEYKIENISNKLLCYYEESL